MRDIVGVRICINISRTIMIMTRIITSIVTRMISVIIILSHNMSRIRIRPILNRSIIIG